MKTLTGSNNITMTIGSRPTLTILSGGGPPPIPESTEGCFIILAGNLSNGYEAWGTFDSFNAATQYSLQYFYDKETWIMPLKIQLGNTS